MALKTYNPVTPNLRHLVVVDRSGLHKGAPVKELTEGLNGTGGRNNHGRVTSRRMGGGVKRRYRLVTISPLKNAQKLNEIGAEMSQKYGVNYLFSDFKKREGYKRSIELSEIYNLYRQNFCGCEFSKNKNN